MYAYNAREYGECDGSSPMGSRCHTSGMRIQNHAGVTLLPVYMPSRSDGGLARASSGAVNSLLFSHISIYIQFYIVYLDTYLCAYVCWFVWFACRFTYSLTSP